ncbi:MAG TPA: hypothetical protein VFN87_01755 [Solirubrobacteraceae bacterium]|nr:hypothetical protein [Solirubrobacteraceae bacterium]
MGVEVNARAAACGLRRILTITSATAALALTAAPGALGAGKPVAVGTPYAGGPPAVAVDTAGNAVVAWANTKDLGGSLNFVQYCVLPPGASACSHSGNLNPADSAQYIDNVQVLNDGGTIVILADVYGTAGTAARDYTPEQERQSTDGGASFSIVNGGLSVSSGILSADTVPLNAVIVPGTNVLGYGWETAGGPPTFNAFPLVSPPECSVATCPAGFATLEPNTNPDQVTNGGGMVAAQAGANPGVLGIYTTLFSNGPFACPNNTPNGIAFAYGSGNQGAGNSYNVSPGSPGSAWRLPATQGDCGVEAPAVAGGPSGFGVLEDDQAHATTVYHRFDQAKMTFSDTPMVTVSKQGELDAALSQDGAGGIYGTYLNGGSGGPVALSYSADGGKTWAGPGTLDAYNGEANVTSSVNGAGQGWAAWINNGSVYAQSFTAADAITAPSLGGGGSSNGQTVTLNVSCTAYPCTVTITLTAPETIVVHASSARVGKRRVKHRTVKLAAGRVTLRRGGTVTLRLTGAGKRFVRSRRGHVRVTAGVTERFGRYATSRTRTISLRITTGKRHRRR